MKPTCRYGKDGFFGICLCEECSPPVTPKTKNTMTPTKEQIEAALAGLRGDATHGWSEIVLTWAQDNKAPIGRACVDILAAALLAAQRDSERLDWLGGEASLAPSPHGVVRQWCVKDPGDIVSYREIRLVIDAAIAAAKGVA